MGYNTIGFFKERSIIMSFDVNFNKPIIKEAQAMQNDGGAGNLGYFEQERKNKDKSIFSEEADSFKKSTDTGENLDVEFSISKFFENLLNTLKAWFKKLLGLS